MMRQQYIDRICAETLSGRFGPSVIPPQMICKNTRAAATLDAAATFRNATLWTSARSGGEQGNL